MHPELYLGAPSLLTANRVSANRHLRLCRGILSCHLDPAKGHQRQFNFNRNMTNSFSLALCVLGWNRYTPFRAKDTSLRQVLQRNLLVLTSTIVIGGDVNSSSKYIFSIIRLSMNFKKSVLLSLLFQPVQIFYSKS